LKFENPSRRRSAPIIAIIFPFVFFPLSTMAADRRPNVLLIVADDHSADVIGAYGNKKAQTPNIDRLAAEGVRFDRAYCNAPICTASRQSFLTGRYPHAVGVTLLHHVLDDGAYTLAHRFHDAGYRTAAFGKMHFNARMLHGFDTYYDEDLCRKEFAQRPLRPLPLAIDTLPAWRPGKDPARIWLNSFYRPLGRYDEDMPGTQYARHALAYLNEHRAEPFFVQIGFTEPHSPYHFPIEFYHRYSPADFAVPVPGPEDAGQIPKVFAELTREEKQGIIASYYTSVAFLDMNIGSVLAGLDALKLADDTLVIYIGDHGYHLGEHGRFEKHSLYERAVRAPLIMRFPGHIKSGTSTKAFAEFVDIVPTALDYAGLPVDRDQSPPRDLHGFSLKPLLDGKVDSVREAVFAEYQHTEEAMIRTDRYKLIYQTSKAPDFLWIGYEPVVPPQGRSVRLFDVQADPDEMHNLADRQENAKVVSDLLDRLADRYRRIPPVGPPPPADLSREAFLDWAIAPRYAGKPATPPRGTRSPAGRG